MLLKCFCEVEVSCIMIDLTSSFEENICIIHIHMDLFLMKNIYIGFFTVKCKNVLAKHAINRNVLRKESFFYQVRKLDFLLVTLYRKIL